MDNTSNSKPVDQDKQQKPKPEWYDSLIRIVQEILDFNQLTYKKEKVKRL